MENINSLPLNETGLYPYPRCSFRKAFNEFNITSVGQVLDDNLMTKIMLQLPCEAREELEGTISLIKYKYLGVPILNDEIMNAKTYISEKDGWHVPKGGLLQYLERFGLGNNCYRCDWDFIHSLMRRVVNASPKVNDISNIEILRTALNDYHPTKRVKTVFELLVENYVTNQEVEEKSFSKEGDVAIKSKVSFLKGQLEALLDVRDSLDKRIAAVQEEINKLSTEQGVIR